MAKLNAKLAQVNELTKHLWAVHNTATKVHRRLKPDSAVMNNKPLRPAALRKLCARLSNLRDSYMLLYSHFDARCAEWLDLLQLAAVYTNIISVVE